MSSIKIALIVFICLTVASLTYTVIMFTGQADLDAAKTQADQNAQSANTAAQQAKGQLGALTTRVLGKSVEDPTKVEDEMKTAMEPFVKDQRLGLTPDATVLTVLSTLYKAYVRDADLLAKTTTERDAVAKQLAGLTEAADAKQKQFTTAAEDLLKKYEELEKAVTANREAWNQQVEELKKKVEGATNTAAQQLAGERQKSTKLEQQLDQNEKRVKELVSTLASYRPNADRLSFLQMADGEIIRALPGDGLVYVGLGAKDQLKPGITFSVYSRTRGIPENGQGKATIEVTRVFDSTSEAKITSSTPGDPILENDIIANPVYDRRRHFNFAVAGDFDLNFDGKPEDVSGQRVSQLIERWGGKTVNTVDTRTDFVVLGDPPPLAPKPGATDDDAARQRAAGMEKVRQDFEKIKSEAQALSIPILTRVQFLHFLGTTVPKSVDAAEAKANSVKKPAAKPTS